MHLFVVSQQTLPVHLQYEFAGVTIKRDCSWDNVTLPGNPDRTQASLYADICRVHPGDQLLFYLERPDTDRTREGGRFLGIFEVVSDCPFYEPGGEYLHDELGMPLVYRLLIRPAKIFQQGITEWMAMDEMSHVREPHDIPWTVIYRKMTGRRGCTPLLPHEAQLIARMLDLRNAGQSIRPKHAALDTEGIQLAESDIHSEYAGDTDAAHPIDAHLRHLMNKTKRKWELHLQAYLMQEIGRNTSLTQHLFPAVTLSWIGNEIYAGAGRQQIDILVYSENDLNQFIHLIELKADPAGQETPDQVNRYIKWLRAHIPGVSVHQIVPTVIAPAVEDGYHRTMKTYLAGHGITQYRVITVDGDLNFSQEICPAL
jgi:hypothetical protein